MLTMENNYCVMCYTVLLVLISSCFLLSQETSPGPVSTGGLPNLNGSYSIDSTKWVYKEVDGKELTMTVFLPDNYESSDKSFPAIVIFHGGSWNAGDVSWHFPDCEYWSKRGMIAASVDYRLKDRDGVKVPLECVKDAKSAVRFLRKNADQLKVDPQRIVSAGGSAGGQMAAALAMITAEDVNDDAYDLSISCIPNAVILWNPWFKCEERLSPTHNVDSGLPPFCTFAGGSDTAIPVEEMVDFHDSLDSCGNYSALYIGKEGKHGFCNGRNESNRFFYWSLELEDQFLVKHGILTGTSMVERPGWVTELQPDEYDVYETSGWQGPLPEPRSFYDFEEGTGLDASDQGSAGNHGKFFGDAIDWSTGGIVNQPGDPDGCIEFAGDPYSELSFVEVPYVEFHDSPDYTFTTWVQWLGDPTAFGYVFWQNGEVWPEEDPKRHVDLWIHGPNGNMAAFPFDEYRTGYAMTPNTGQTGFNVLDGDWHLVGISLEDSTILKVWTDGVIIATDTSEVPIIMNGEDELWIGARPNDATLTGCVKMIGLMDRVRIWDRAFNELQMDYLYRMEGPDGSTAIAQTGSVPTEFGLQANYPNPFNPTTTIAYSLDKTQDASVVVYDILGHKVKTLTSGVQTSGNHLVRWKGTNDAGQKVSSGIYLYRLESQRNFEIRKMMLLK